VLNIVEEIEKNDKKYYTCGICGFVYGEEKNAKDCEEWCSKHSTCSLEITKNALFRSKEDII
jgi:hypothetical protein